MLNRTKVSTGIVALALLIAAPLEATETPEADAPYAALTLETAAPAACAELASVTGEVGATMSLGISMCPDEVVAAAALDAGWECWQHGQIVDELEINCFYLGGGYWSYSARVSCKVPPSNTW
ncbi:MAG: hypothetical protein OXI39_00575 [Gemmatimonadota bacterium]|uniref:hypothetical protein n=1 Tax=Candidatus Palauibacter scopulicola TaxID=3056741 RepID=UPI0023A03225|nr:hypothetical protein [Candidatus Palauibacter scopulicola]MDE2661486.1 hypothetical protein [Candidatus Palauibacter scopulicola]